MSQRELNDRQLVSLDEHPYVRGARARLANAERAAKMVPFPYPIGTPVEFITPVGSRFGGRVTSCDYEDGYVTIEALNAPAGWPEPVLHFHACSWPEHIAGNGVLTFRTETRVHPERGDA